MIHITWFVKTDSQATIVVEQTRLEVGVLSVTRWSSGIFSKFFFYKFFCNLKFRIN